MCAGEERDAVAVRGAAVLVQFDERAHVEERRGDPGALCGGAGGGFTRDEELQFQFLLGCDLELTGGDAARRGGLATLRLDDGIGADETVA